jgi:hypothetical protein
MILFVTTPAPTVLPPSRIAKRCCLRERLGATSLLQLHRVTWHNHFLPSGSVTSPVTSVVRT